MATPTKDEIERAEKMTEQMAFHFIGKKSLCTRCVEILSQALADTRERETERCDEKIDVLRKAAVFVGNSINMAAELVAEHRSGPALHYLNQARQRLMGALSETALEATKD